LIFPVSMYIVSGRIDFKTTCDGLGFIIAAYRLALFNFIRVLVWINGSDESLFDGLDDI
jgi:hypothetical protein